MAVEDNKFKTGVTATVIMTLTITGEVLSSLPQLIIVFYYIRNGKRIKFSRFAKDLNTQEVLDAIAAGIAVHAMVIDVDTVTMVIPPEDTATLEISDCEEVPVFAQVGYIDSSGNTEKDIPEPACDTAIGFLVGSVTEGLL